MRLLPSVLAAMLCVGCTGGGGDQPPPEEPLLPGGYRTHLDPGRSDPGQFTVGETPEMVRFTTGPAGLAWRPQDVVEPGDVLVEGTLHVYGAPVDYREGYGVFVGGRDLESSDASYAYLMVRPSGDFTIRERRGDVTETVVDWTPHDAVQGVGVDGDEPVNTLGIQARGAEVAFTVNGAVVFRMGVSDVELQGLAGIRVNHRLDVGLTTWSLGPPPPPVADSTSGT
ncbi:MAG TPA: hypothetical protein VLA36_05695 [Longimicrobiales bacterium]|nr:hypothetical protein [Longimicrobiales bacterium]